MCGILMASVFGKHRWVLRMTQQRGVGEYEKGTTQRHHAYCEGSRDAMQASPTVEA